MNAQLDKILCARYPTLLLANTRQNDDQFFFECGSGWFEVINATLAVINKRSTINNLGVTVTQVKEKFGALRIYCAQADDYITTAAEIAEQISELTCEICGNKGSIITVKGWNLTRCKIHRLTTASDPAAATMVSSEHSTNLAEAIESILGLFSSNPRWALEWLKKPALIFGYNKPYEMLQTCEGCKALIGFIGKLEHGVLP